ncbi:MAG: DinB family protein [Blastocatellia bacterium]|nr:DinB family protein [Blastocatellia bacterium]MBN8725752.1 DinB family protein [Acidobacteriota bacterium]
MSEIKTTFDELQSLYYGNAFHGPALKEILEGINATQALAKPIPNAHNIWELVLHILGWNKVFLLGLEGKILDVPEDGDFPIINDTSQQAWQKTLVQLKENIDEMLEKISKLSEAHLGVNIPGKDYNLRFVIGGIFNHIVYHSGQIALLKKA